MGRERTSVRMRALTFLPAATLTEGRSSRTPFWRPREESNSSSKCKAKDSQPCHCPPSTEVRCLRRSVRTVQINPIELIITIIFVIIITTVTWRNLIPGMRIYDIMSPESSLKRLDCVMSCLFLWGNRVFE